LRSIPRLLCLAQMLLLRPALVLQPVRTKAYLVEFLLDRRDRPKPSLRRVCSRPFCGQARLHLSDGVLQRLDLSLLHSAVLLGCFLGGDPLSLHLGDAIIFCCQLGYQHLGVLHDSGERAQ
jgi:hypothetical protein